MAYQRNGYWYRSVRDGDRVRTEYLGTGPLAEAIATLDTVEKEERGARRAAARAERKAQREVDQAIDAAGDALRELTSVVLLASGYHRHKGQWRKRRYGRRAAGEAETRAP